MAIDSPVGVGVLFFVVVCVLLLSLHVCFLHSLVKE